MVCHPPGGWIPHALIISPPPFGMMAADPALPMLPPPVRWLPDMVIVPVSPPSGMMAAHPIRMISPPPGRVVPLVDFVVVAGPQTGVYRLSGSGRGNHENGRQRHQRGECYPDSAHLRASI